MQVPDATAVAGFVAIGSAIFAAVKTIGKPIVDAYIRNMDRSGEALIESTKAQTQVVAKTMGDISATLTTLLQEHRTHDALSGAAHNQAAEAMKEVVKTLKGDENAHRTNNTEVYRQPAVAVPDRPHPKESRLEESSGVSEVLHR